MHWNAGSNKMSTRPKIEPYPSMRIVDLSRQCPLCEGADRHLKSCVLYDKEHVYTDMFFTEVNWDATFLLNNILQ